MDLYGTIETIYDDPHIQFSNIFEKLRNVFHIKLKTLKNVK